MPPTLLKGGHVPIRLWTRPHELDSLALRQLRAIASLPWVAHHVAVMPDVHVGKGATVGSVIAMRGAVAPAAVGVDIGCGMAALPTTLRCDQLPDDLRELRLELEQAVPVGPRQHAEPALSALPAPAQVHARALLERFDQLPASVQSLAGRAARQLGTLGGGNHFLEVCRDTDDRIWVLLHSGSRHVGAVLAEHHMALAQRACRGQPLPDPDLAVFLAGTPEFEAYRRDLLWAQDYAALNRALLVALVQPILRARWPSIEFGEPISCHHNYVAEEEHYGESLLVTRKGAIRAGWGELGIIPGSMGARSFIVRGRGNALSFESASHGAGRRLSRNQARRSFTVADLKRQTAGVECRKDRGVLDEAPHAYKDIGRVMEDQADLVEVVTELKQLICIKG